MDLFLIVQDNNCCELQLAEHVHAKKTEQMHHTVTGLIAMQICNLCHGIIAAPDKKKWHATHQVPCRHHPTVAELRWKSHLLSLQTTRPHTDSMITLNHSWTAELICSLPDVASAGTLLCQKATVTNSAKGSSNACIKAQCCQARACRTWNRNV